MPSANSLNLVNVLENLPELDGRYTQLKCVNISSLTGEQRGVFSLVFRAFDQIDQRQVALKFYDIDPAKYFDQYRVTAFQREHSILQTLLGVRRCLQLASAYSIYNLQVPHPNGTSFSLPCPYFAVEWLDEEIDSYFEKQDSCDPVEKLRIFYEIVLAVEALHRNNIYHRDLKKDNLRASYDQMARLIVAIDFGTAARLDSPQLRASYDNGPVGAPAYTAPEGICGLAGIREIAKYTDIYALGCLLFELFNRDYFVRELLSQNPNYQAILTVMGYATRTGSTPSEKLQLWQNALSIHSQGVTPVSILASANSVPAGVGQLLDDLVKSMTKIDYRGRPKCLEFVRRRIQSAITVLNNERSCKLRVEAAQERRRDRIARIAAKEKRLAIAMSRRIQNAE